MHTHTTHTHSKKIYTNAKLSKSKAHHDYNNSDHISMCKLFWFVLAVMFVGSCGNQIVPVFKFPSTVSTELYEMSVCSAVCVLSLVLYVPTSGVYYFAYKQPEKE